MYTTIKSEYFNINYKDCSPIKGNLKLSYILIYRFSIQIFQIKRQTICKVVKIIKIIFTTSAYLSIFINLQNIA